MKWALIYVISTAASGVPTATSPIYDSGLRYNSYADCKRSAIEASMEVPESDKFHQELLDFKCMPAKHETYRRD
jgi:hypothetical protein